MDTNKYLDYYSEGEYVSPYEAIQTTENETDESLNEEELSFLFEEASIEEEHSGDESVYETEDREFEEAEYLDFEEEEEETIEHIIYDEQEINFEAFEDEFYADAEAELEEFDYESYADESMNDYYLDSEEYSEEEIYIEEEGYIEDEDEDEQGFFDAENIPFDHEAEYLFEDFWSSLKRLWKSSRKPRTPSHGTSSSYWASFGNRAACIAQKEWEHWDKGKRHETNPAFQKRLLSYYSSTQMSAQRAQRAAKSNLNRNSKTRSPWSAAFISYVIKKAGAGEYFHYNSSHLNYMLAAKKNRLQGEQNPFQLFDLKQAKPKLGDLVCNSRGCFDKTYSNIETAKSTRCGDSKYAATFSHCDMVVEVDEKNNRVWVIGGNTGNKKELVGGLGAGTVGKKTRKLDSNGYLIAEKGIFALLKVRTDLNVPAPTQGANHTPCSTTISKTTSSVSHGSNTASVGQSTGNITTSFVNKLSALLNKGIISLSVYLSIVSGNRNVNQLTDMVFHARHKELNGRKLRSSDKGLIQEWQTIKKNVIMPLIRSMGSESTPVNTSPSPNTGSTSKRNNSFLKRIQPYSHIIESKAKKYKLNPNIIRAIIAAESNGNPRTRSVANYKGLMQSGRTDAHYDPTYSIEEGTKKFAKFRNIIVQNVLKRTGVDLNKIDSKTLLRMTLAGYNAGPVTVIKAIEYAHGAGNWKNWLHAEHYQRALVFSGGYHKAKKCHRGASIQAIEKAKKAKSKFSGWRKNKSNWRTFQDPPLLAKIEIPSIMSCWVKTKHGNTLPYLSRFDQFI